MLFLLLACATEAPSGPPRSEPTEPTALADRREIDLDAFIAAAESEILLLDVRTKQEFESGHVPKAKHLPLAEVTPQHWLLRDHAKSDPVYVICESGARSGRAAKALAAGGFTAINVTAGTAGWRARGLPLETP